MLFGQIIRKSLAAVVILGATTVVASDVRSETETAVTVLAGGCFWCVESDFDKVDGVLSTVSGFAGGHTPDPTYKQVTYGRTGHLEAVQIEYDPSKVSFEELVDIFWRSVDPTDDGGQFCDRGDSYRTAVFVGSDEERRIAEESKRKVDESGVLPSPVVTRILNLDQFFPASDNHQDFYTKRPGRYKYYRTGCGRDARIRRLWGEEAHRGIRDS